MRVKSSTGVREPAFVEVEDVDVPDAAHLDMTHPEVIERGALHLEVRRDLIGESRKPPHGAGCCHWVRAEFKKWSEADAAQELTRSRVRLQGRSSAGPHRC